jgi:hypothetical protein
MIEMTRRIAFLVFLLAFLLPLSKIAVGKETIPKIGPLKLNPHPSNLIGKTVLLRWNGKMNGDKYLESLGNLLSYKYKGIKIIKVWKMLPETAIISRKTEISERIGSKIAAMKPDVVIAAQAD